MVDGKAVEGNKAAAMLFQANRGVFMMAGS